VCCLAFKMKASLHLPEVLQLSCASVLQAWCKLENILVHGLCRHEARLSSFAIGFSSLFQLRGQSLKIFAAV